VKPATDQSHSAGCGRKTPDDMRILGIDPALRCTGYGVLDVQGATLRVVDCGVIRTAARRPVSECLRRLAGGIAELLESYAPSVVAIEGGFYSRNARTAMVLGCARGVVIAGAATRGIPVFEYAPRRIKQAVCGHGHAGKVQVATILCQLTGIEPAELQSDATDALAAAFCHNSTASGHQGLFLPDPL
jgi:crossover junction endodeoxyribonuclease RuvC